MIRLSKAWSGDPIREHRTLEIDAPRVYVRLWLQPFTRGYAFSDFGPLCFGFAWFGAMIFFARRST